MSSEEGEEVVTRDSGDEAGIARGTRGIRDEEVIFKLLSQKIEEKLYFVSCGSREQRVIPNREGGEMARWMKGANGSTKKTTWENMNRR